ncbi:hypothetical protein [Mycolicibacterium elephantis]
MKEPRVLAARERMRVLVYSHNAATRGQVLTGLGSRPHPGLPEVEYVEAATHAAAIALVHTGNIGLAILDGEATPAGGMAIAKQVRNEVDECPPIIVLIGRSEDGWLARWAQADAVVVHPLDAIRLAEALAALVLSA